MNFWYVSEGAKKLFSAYNTGRKLVFLVLADCEVLRVLFLQVFKHDVHWVLKLFVILTDLHGIDKLDQGGEVLFLYRGFVVDIADQGTVKQRFSLRPEFVTGFAVAFGIGDQCCNELQDVLFTVDIGEGIVVHALLEINGIQDPDLVPVLLQSMAALEDDRTFRQDKLG